MSGNSFRSRIVALLAISVVVSTSGAVSAQSSSTVVLRDLTVIPDVLIEAFDDNEVRLSDGARLSWDQILRADVPDEQRAEFDRRLSQIGLPLFRIKSRLASGDWWSIGSIAEPMYDLIRPGGDASGFQFDVRTRYLISMAAMYGRIHSGERELAVEPFVLAAMLQPQIPDAVDQPFALSADEVESGICHRLLPVWFDRAHARLSLNEFSANVGAGGFPAVGGVLIYRASLAIAAGEFAVAGADIDQLRLQGSHPDWVKVLEASLLVSQDRIDEGLQLLRARDSFSRPCRAVALYLEGMHPSPSALSSDASLVSLLTIPALFGESFEELASAALYGAAERTGADGKSGDRRILTNELLRRYPNTYHGRLAASNEK